MLRTHRPAFALCLLLVAPLAAQVPAPQTILDAFAARTATLQVLDLPASPGLPFQARVVLGGMRCTLILQPSDVRAPGFQLLVADATGVHALPPPPSVTFRGVVAEQPDSVVAASLLAGQLEALVLLRGELWAVQPTSDGVPLFPFRTHVVYRAADAHVPGIRCGNLGLETRAPAAQPLAGNKEAEIAIDGDYDYFLKNGSNVMQTQSAITSVINGVDAIYQRDVQIQYAITKILVRTTRAPYTTTDMGTLLVQFQNEWNANQGAIKRDLAHLFTGVGVFSGVVGISYVGVVCDIPNAYGVSKAFHTNLSVNVGLVAHEVGHNWNAQHCDSYTPCNIMCSGIGGCSNNISMFAPVSISTITAFKSTRGCLTDPVPFPPTITSLTPSTTTSFNSAEITVKGTLLDSVTSLTVGGTPASKLTLVDASTLKFVPPTPFQIATHPVVATNARGPSNAQNLSITGNHPSVLGIFPIVLRGYPIPHRVHTDSGWSAVLLLSTHQTPSVLPGIVSLGIGAGFTDLFVIASLTADNAGTASIDITVPTSVPASTVLYWQAITYQTPTAPLEVSNVQQVTTL